MTCFARRLFAPLLALGLAALAAAADPRTPASPPSPTDRIDWSGFAAYGDVVGGVMKADDTGLPLRMSWYPPGKAATTGGPNRTSSRYRGRSSGGNQNNQMMQRM